jgi:hypothetical protein
MIMDIASIIKEDRLLRTMLRISNSESSKSAKRVGAVFICLFFCPFSLGHCVVWPSSMYGFWLPLWYLQTHFGYCVVFPSIFGFWFPLWYLQTPLILSGLLRKPNYSCKYPHYYIFRFKQKKYVAIWKLSRLEKRFWFAGHHHYINSMVLYIDCITSITAYMVGV